MTVTSVLRKLPRFPNDDPTSVTGSDGYDLRFDVASRYSDARRLFEFGGHFGHGLVTLLEACPNATWAGWTDNESLIPGSNQACRENLTAWCKQSGRKVGTWYSEQAIGAAGQRADLVVVDGDHGYHGAMIDLSLAAAMRPIAVLVHDVENIGGVMQAVENFVDYTAATCEIVSGAAGLAVIEWQR